MKKKGVLVPYIQTIQNMYDEITTSVKTPSEETKDFPTRVAFCPYLVKYGMCLPET